MLALSEPDPNSRARASGGFAHPHTRLNPAWRSRDLRLCWWEMSLAARLLASRAVSRVVHVPWLAAEGASARIARKGSIRTFRAAGRAHRRGQDPRGIFAQPRGAVGIQAARKGERLHRFTPSIFRLSRRLPPTSRAISKPRCARWDCPSVSRREPAIRHPTSAPVRSRSRPTSC